MEGSRRNMPIGDQLIFFSKNPHRFKPKKPGRTYTSYKDVPGVLKTQPTSPKSPSKINGASRPSTTVVLHAQKPKGERSSTSTFHGRSKHFVTETQIVSPSPSYKPPRMESLQNLFYSKEHAYILTGLHPTQFVSQSHLFPPDKNKTLNLKISYCLP